MTDEFYGASLSAQRRINRLLNLNVSSREQDWEFELADPSRVDDMLDVASETILTLDEKSALALLLLASIDGRGDLTPLQIQRTREFVCHDQSLRARMLFFWRERPANHNDLVQQVLGAP